MIVNDIKTATITPKGQISIPLSARSKRFKIGTKVAILSFEDRIQIVPLAEFSEKYESLILSSASLGKEWNSAKDDKAFKNL